MGALETMQGGGTLVIERNQGRFVHAGDIPDTLLPVLMTAGQETLEVVVTWTERHRLYSNNNWTNVPVLCHFLENNILLTRGTQTTNNNSIEVLTLPCYVLLSKKHTMTEKAYYLYI